MQTIIQIILSTVAVSLISFVGVLALALSKKKLEKALFFLIALSIGGLMGGAFLHLLPEAAEQFEGGNVFLFTLAGFFLFFIVEKLIHWRHCHEGHCPVHTFAYMNLIGDSIHNFIDGLVLAGSFIASPALGIASTLAVVLHEIPQEIGDFGVLVYGGISKKRAIFYNFLTAATAILGGIMGFYFLSFAGGILKYLLAFAAGGFIYIAATDLIPEIAKENNIRRSALNFGVVFLGILAMFLLRFAGA